MNTIKLIFALTAVVCLGTLITGCEDPEPVNQEELITTLKLTFTTVGGGSKVLQYRDLDGIGGNAPVIISDTLTANTNYSVSVEVLNESVNPADSINAEIRAEDEDHQFFFQPAAGLNLSFSYADTDDDGYPVGLSSTAQAGVASNGQLTVTLRHEPDKHASGVENGDITNAGGETDAEVVFDVVIQ